MACVWRVCPGAGRSLLLLPPLCSAHLTNPDVTGALVHWFAGSLVSWFAGSRVVGSLVNWYAGSLVRWFAGALARWFAGHLDFLLGYLECRPLPDRIMSSFQVQQLTEEEISGRSEPLINTGAHSFI